ncbi:MAG: SusC/RagA family TonB-linked outer membrane protein [Bacteroidota bacterium]
MKKIIFLFLALTFSVTAIAQQVITGTVTEAETGDPLVGVTVMVEGTTIGSITNADGSYEIEVPQDMETLVFSFVGYSTVEVPIEGRSSIDVQLEVDITRLDDVVVIGYGTQRKVSITNAVSNVTAEELAERNATNINQALQGKLPGLTIIDYGGAPGVENIMLRIRGTTSLNENAPLVLIDGVPGDLARLNPVDIESVSILKDAAASAIYGSRAAAGVILVTTKSAESGELSVSYNGYYGIARTNNNPVHMDAVPYMKLQNEAYLNSFGFQYYTDEYIEQWPQNHANDPEMYPVPHQWFDALYSLAPQQSHTLTFSGGNEKLSTRVSARYMDQDGVLPHYNFKIAELRANTDYNVSDKLRFNTNLNLRNTIRKEPYNPWGGWTRLTYRILQNSQWAVPRYEDGSYGLSVDSYSPLILANEGGLTEENNTYLLGIFRGEYDIIEGLTLRGQYSIQYDYGYSSSFANKYFFQDKLHPSRTTVSNLNYMIDNRSQSREDGVDLQLTFDRSFGLHTINSIAGYSQIHFENTYVGGYRQQFYNNDLQALSLGVNDATQSATGGNSEWGLRSYFARVNYDYSGKYLFEANARYDGSSRFSEGNRYGFFPSFSLGWRISNESFWDPIKNVVNELKLRGSWGQVGSQTVGLYTYLETYNQSNYIFNESRATGYRQTSLASQDLSWETTTQFNVGLDGYLFDNRINFSADYYKKTTTDILLALPIPTLIGLNPTDQNAGIVENWGLEFVLGGRQTFGDFRLALDFNLNFNHNEVVDLAGTGPYISAYGNSDYRTITREGFPISSFYGFETDGFFQTQEEVDGYANWDGSVGPGDVKYVDQNNDGILTPEDFVILGNEMPDWTFSSNMSFGWKGLTLDLFWQGVTGSEKLITGAMLEMGIWGGFCHEVFEDYWTPENTDAQFPRPTKYTMKNVQISDRTMVDGSYLRLKNIRLSYDIPQSLSERVNINNISVYISATNLLTFAELNMYDIDPEMIGRGPESSFPQTSVTTIGLNVNF